MTQEGFGAGGRECSRGGSEDNPRTLRGCPEGILEAPGDFQRTSRPGRLISARKHSVYMHLRILGAPFIREGFFFVSKAISESMI